MRKTAFLALLGLMGASSMAAPSPSPSASKISMPSPGATPSNGGIPVDTLQEQLFKSNKSKKARALKNAYAALKNKQFAQARTFAQKVKGDELFSDYYFYISASADQGEAGKAFEDGHYKDSESFSQKSLAMLFKLETDMPYSPFLKGLGKEIAKSELIAGNAQAALNNFKGARTTFERAFQRLSTPNNLDIVTPANLKAYSLACSKKKNKASDDICLIWLIRFAGIYPRNSEEMKAIGKLFPDVLQRAKPAQPVGKVSQVYKAPDLDQVAFDAAMALYSKEKYTDAISGFRRFLDDYPKSVYRFRARYWLAQSFSHKQEHENAQKAYEDLQHDSPLSYYGLLASIASGKNMDTYLDLALPVATNRDNYLLPHEIIRVKRAEKFIVEGALDLAAFELKDLKARDSLSAQYLMYLATLNFQSQNYNTAFQILTDLIQRGTEGVFSTHTVRMIFPVVFMDLIKKYSTENQLDPILVLSLIKQESAFDPTVNSNVGASGLMQLMPSTAVDTISDITRAELLEPESNIRVGTKYLRKLLIRYNGNIVLALAAYNAGPGAVDRWVREDSYKRGMLEFIESIPYRETREYVSSIVRNYFWYSKNIANDSPKSLSYFWNSETPNPAPVPAPTPAETPDITVSN